jgi:hypothetical protein
MKALLLTCGRSEGAFATMARVSAVAARIMPVDIYSLDTQPLEEFSALLIGMHVDQRFLAARGRRLDH